MIQKQSVNINFAEGLDTKTDPKQLSVGKFLTLQNSVFTQAGRLTKRNGFAKLTTLPTTTPSSYLTTLNNSLTAVGNSVYSYNNSNSTWTTKGVYTPIQLSTLPILRNSLGQVQADSAVAPNGLVCTAYTESNGATLSYKFVVADSTTGQNIVPPTLIPVSTGTVTGTPRVFLLGNYFVIVFTRLVSSTSHLSYVSVSSVSPTASSLPTNDIATAYTPSVNMSWDGTVADGSLYVAYNTTSGGQTVAVTFLSQSAAATGGAATSPNTTTGSTFIATSISVTADLTSSNLYVYVSFYNSNTQLGYMYAVGQTLNQLMAVTGDITAATAVTNLTTAAQKGTCQLFYEVVNAYGYDSSIPTNYIITVTVTPPTSGTGAGNIGASAISVRSVGLASKAFIVSGVVYYLAAYQSSATAGAGFQPTYFLINGSTSRNSAPVVVAKLAYSNGGGYITSGLPSVTVMGQQAQVAYLFKDLIEAQSPAGVESIGLVAPSVYTQTGINLGTFTFGTQNISSLEIASALQLSGGFGWSYDGYLPVEENFFLWPDSVEYSASSAAITKAGSFTTGGLVITVGSTVGLGSGMTVVDSTSPTALASGTLINQILSATTLSITKPATGTSTTDTLSFAGSISGQPTGFVSGQPVYYYQAIYSWTDNQGNEYNSAPSIPVPVTGLTSATTYIISVAVPTLRLTYKIASPIKIRLYRWSVANQVYYEVTSIIQPVLNSTTADYVTIIDPLADASIIGNNIIYTTGGVVEDVNSPASSIMTLFDTRAWKVDAEDQNLLWYSKQVIEATPVEWSDLFTYYVAPNVGTVGSTGPITALAPMDDKLIIFKQDAIYFINGTGPDNTGANSAYPNSPYFITSTVGCSNPRSVVLMQNGLMFQSDKGIWLLDRSLQSTYIGAPVEAFNGATVTSAINVPGTTQIRFALSTGQDLMYDYFYGQWGTFVGKPSVSSCVFQGNHTFLNAQGPVYQESPGTYLDGSNPVLLGFTTGPIDLQGISGYQRAYGLALTGSYASPHRLVMGISFDFGPISQQYVITPTNPTGVYDSDNVYGQTSPYGGPGAIEQWRIQFNQQQCQSFQISLQEFYDPTIGQAAGAGFTLSNMNCLVAVKKGTKPFAARNTTG